ncbi:hypothetical protein B0H63DRAFT_518353 [Podospora didyma]|uniref:Uncharacterized protein n=1 Tax=Podospora didyma TaxID=330526 RepID=A0AAE0U9B4_9PEZI|nr:hypothetical protein B0H63DRAFT_518353 [Podospora didyma]
MEDKKYILEGQPVTQHKPPVTQVDVFCGLLWLHVIRVRRDCLSGTAITRCATAADIRERYEPNVGGSAGELQKVGEDYMGNMILRIKAKVKQLADACWLIRRAVLKLRDPNYVTHGVKLAKEKGSYDIDQSETGLDFSSWAELGADLEFEIPGTASSSSSYGTSYGTFAGTSSSSSGGNLNLKPDLARKTYSAIDGSMNIMPRRGGARGEDADWEVLFALRVKDMDKICGNDQLGKYLAQPVV